jgi:TatA/E family protein of Tat protein translocase
MFGIGMPELVIIFVIALLVFGPKELPKIGKTIGKAMGEFRRASDELKEGIQREIDLADREPTEETPTPEAASSTVPAEPPESGSQSASEPQLELPMAQAPAASVPPAGAPEGESATATATAPRPSSTTAAAVAAGSVETPAPTPAEPKHV